MMKKHNNGAAIQQTPGSAIYVLMAALLTLGLAFALTVPQAAAQTPAINTAKSQCLVGEMSDGYLGFPKSGASEAVRKQVRNINIKRRAEYSSLAKRGGVTVEVAAALTAEKLIRRAKKGHCIRRPNGKWVTVK